MESVTTLESHKRDKNESHKRDKNYWGYFVIS